MSKKDIVLAYSGGLDTTYCAVYLSRNKNYNVHAVTINTGAFGDSEIAELEKKAMSIGAASFKCIDVRENYYNTCIRYLIFGNVLKNSTYPLSVSAERVIQAITIAEYAKSLNIHTIAHGSTGAGNDQVRFDMVFQHILPDAEIITPIRDQQLSREAEIAFLHENNVHFDFVKAAYSVNKGLWGTSVGGRETLTSHQYLPDEAWPTPVTEHEQKEITLSFHKGELTTINDETFDHPVKAIEYLQHLAQPFGIGRDIHVGDTIIGIKGRVGFEAAAPIIIVKAHHLLEKHVLTKWQLQWKDQLAAWYGNWLHEGQLLDPVMRDIEAFFTNSQKTVTGQVNLTLLPYRFILNGISSDHDLMNSKFGSYGEMNAGWTGTDVKGFTKIFGNQTSIYHQVNSTLVHE
ncbi:MAG: argininosuccinate synthase [Bacteroidota bacterium]|nr:argininosuccinate synthase [Bacteroidota bacterium]